MRSIAQYMPIAAVNSDPAADWESLSAPRDLRGCGEVTDTKVTRFSAIPAGPLLLATRAVPADAARTSADGGGFLFAAGCPRRTWSSG